MPKVAAVQGNLSDSGELKPWPPRIARKRASGTGARALL